LTPHAHIASRAPPPRLIRSRQTPMLILCIYIGSGKLCLACHSGVVFFGGFEAKGGLEESQLDRIDQTLLKVQLPDQYNTLLHTCLLSCTSRPYSNTFQSIWLPTISLHVKSMSSFIEVLTARRVFLVIFELFPVLST